MQSHTLVFKLQCSARKTFYHAVKITGDTCIKAVGSTFEVVRPMGVAYATPPKLPPHDVPKGRQ